MGGGRALVELPVHQHRSMIVGSEDRLETVFLLSGEQSGASADRFADPVQVVTSPSLDGHGFRFAVVFSSHRASYRTGRQRERCP